MANLFWKTKNHVRSLLSTPFKTEEEFERLIYDNPVILGDIFPIKRQIRRGGKSGIPDIIGVDSDGNICVIEMKNTTVDANIIPQVLNYAFWAESNPDSIKSLWLECDNKHDDITISWDEFDVRIIILAPEILKSTLDIVNKINYPVDLIEIKRWVEGDNQLLLVNQLAREIKPTVRPSIGLEKYDDAFYKKNYNKVSAEQFLKYVSDLDDIVTKRNWNLEKKFNKHYCGFKAGFFNAFGIQWIGSKTFAYFIKISEAEAKKLSPKATKYQPHWKQAMYYIEPGKTKVRDYIPHFEEAYKLLTGD